MSELWKEYKSDFDFMTDDEIEDQTEYSRLVIKGYLAKEYTEWLEAVASWKAAGKPRSSNAT